MSDTPAQSFAELYAALDPKEQRFVDEYLECLNGALAARRVYGVEAAKQKGYALLQRPDVQATVTAGLTELNARTNNDPDRIIRELMLVAYRDMQDMFDENDAMLPIRDMPPEIRRALAFVEVDEMYEWQGEGDSRRRVLVGYTKKVKLEPKGHALELLGKRLKLWTDKKEIEAGESLVELLRAAYRRGATETQA